MLRARGQVVPSVISLAYLNLERAARWMGLKLPAAFTPHERAGAIGQAVPLAQAGVETITTEYVAERYSPRLSDSHPKTAWAAWTLIRWPMWREAVRGFIRTWTAPNAQNERSKAARKQHEPMTKN
jgi:hypothetical protein